MVFCRAAGDVGVYIVFGWGYFAAFGFLCPAHGGCILTAGFAFFNRIVFIFQFKDRRYGAFDTAAFVSFKKRYRLYVMEFDLHCPGYGIFFAAVISLLLLPDNRTAHPGV